MGDNKKGAVYIIRTATEIMKQWAIHPFLFAIYPIVYLYLHNLDIIVDLTDVLAPLIISIAISAILLLALSFFINKQKAGLITTTALIQFYSFGHIYSSIGNYVHVFEIGFNKGMLLLFFYAITFILILIIIVRAKKTVMANTFLNLTSIILIIMLLSNFAIAISNIKTQQLPPTNIHKSDFSGIKPDIYYIILDEHARFDVLTQEYGYKSTEFIDYLNNKGFYVANSTSNYAITSLSLASSLNMDYLDNTNVFTTIEQARNNEVAALLKEYDYTFFHFRSPWRPTNQNRYADKEIDCIRVTRFMMLVTQTTMIIPFEDHFHLLEGDKRRYLKCVFSSLIDLADQDQPKFVFAHIMAPHEPYVYGQDGEYVFSRDEDDEGYVNQLIYTDKEIMKVIDKLLDTDQKPIIIIQSDHGPATFESMIRDPTDDLVRNRMKILNAYYLPGNITGELYETITPVNTFRIVFNNYFGAEYEMIEDKNYFSRYDQPFNFSDVTDKLKDI